MIKRNIIKSGAVITIVIMTLALTAGFRPDRGGMGPNGGPSSDDFDQHFIEQMIPHHEDAIRMADLAPREAEHGQIKRLAAEIKTAQTKENKQMRSWYRSWYGTDVPEGSQMQHRGGLHGASDLKKLENAEQFDREFIRQMIPHHRMAIMMSRMAPRRAEHEQTRKLAQNIIASQTKEIKEMRRWYRQWYGRN